MIKNIWLNLTLCILMDSSFWFDTINLGQSIVHIKGCHVIILKIMYSFVWRSFYHYKQCRPWWNAALCCIFIRVFTLCKSTCLGDSLIQRVNIVVNLIGTLLIQLLWNSIKFPLIPCIVTDTLYSDKVGNNYRVQSGKLSKVGMTNLLRYTLNSDKEEEKLVQKCGRQKCEWQMTKVWEQKWGWQKWDYKRQKMECTNGNDKPPRIYPK